MDTFSNNIYSHWEWSAPFMESVEEIRTVIDRMSLCGRKISRIRVMGTSFLHGRDCIEDCAYAGLNSLPEEERQFKSEYENIDSDMLYPCLVQVDEPILIGFSDGDTFEIDTPREALFRISMNCIPWDIKVQGNDTIADADRFFEACMEQTIACVEVNTYKTDKRPLYRDAFEEPPFEREFVSDITLRLENGCALIISPWIDFCEMGCIDSNGELLQIRFGDLKPILRGNEDVSE